MVWPHFEETPIPVGSVPGAQLAALRLPSGLYGLLTFAVLNGFAASPARIEM